MAGFPSFRQQAEAKSPWQLEDDSRHGFSQAVNNNQPQMALYYVQALFKEYDARIEALEHQLESYIAAPKATVASRKKATDEA